MTTQLDSKSVTLDASGSGTVTFLATGGNAWSIQSMATSATSGSGIKLQVYRNQATANNLVAGSVTAELDSADGAPITMRQGGRLIGAYSGGPVGAVCTLTLSGEIVND